jgi:cell division protein FtsB
MKKSTTIVGLALTILVVYAILNLVNIKEDLKDAMEQTSLLKAEIEQAQETAQELGDRIEAAADSSGAESEARQRLRLIGADETVFTDIN